MKFCLRNDFHPFHKKKTAQRAVFSFGRSDWTRTSDLYVPNVAFYQAELHSDNEAYIYHKK